MADLTARQDHWTDYLPQSWQHNINTSPLLNALGRALNKPTPNLERAALDTYGTPDQRDEADRQWLLQKAQGPSWLERNPSAADGLNKLGMLANFVGPGVKLPAAAPKPTGIRAYHGSPHDFDKFDISKIGTGEGAQAYGPGLYFAEVEDVARIYRDALSPRGDVLLHNGKPVDYRDPLIQAADAVRTHGSRERAIAGHEWALRELLKATGGRMPAYGQPVSIKRTLDTLRSGQELPTLEKGPYPGRMYEVRINADPEQFLDWDKPLAQQPEAVKKIIEPALRTAALDMGKGATPEVLARFEGMGLKNIADRMRPKEIDPWSLDAATLAQQYPNALRDAGIPGVKYLDRMSRTAGEGSRNFVVFDDKLIKILRKYGLLPPVAAGTAAALNQEQPQQ